MSIFKVENGEFSMELHCHLVSDVGCLGRILKIANHYWGIINIDSGVILLNGFSMIYLNANIPRLPYGEPGVPHIVTSRALAKIGISVI